MPHLVFRVETPYPENPDEIDGPSASMEVIKKTEGAKMAQECQDRSNFTEEFHGWNFLDALYIATFVAHG